MADVATDATDAKVMVLNKTPVQRRVWLRPNERPGAHDEMT